jgi:hypothetical protein
MEKKLVDRLYAAIVEYRKQHRKFDFPKKAVLSHKDYIDTTYELYAAHGLLGHVSMDKCINTAFRFMDVEVVWSYGLKDGEIDLIAK